MVQRDETTLSELRRGALVLASDYELGSLDSIRPAQGDEGPMLIVRHGYADYLLVVPADAIADSEPTRIHLKLRREDAERLLFEQDADAGPTLPTPPVDSLLGKPVIEPPDGPGTG